MKNPGTQLQSLWDDKGNILSLAPLRKRIDQLFEDFGRDFALPSFFDTDPRLEFRPTAELHDGEKELTIRVELPGVEAKDVQVTATDRTIDISGEKKSETERKSGDRYTSERHFGSFQRHFALPYAIDPAKVDAKFDKGVLTLKVGKPAEARAQTHRVQVHG